MTYYKLISLMPKFSLDVDAQAFITATGITDATQITAVNNLVLGLKSNNIWSKMKALYPFVGGTATTHKFNLKDPRDVDAAFRLTFATGWTHSANGALPNGTNAFANAFITNSAMSYTSTHLSIYSRTNSITAGMPIGNTTNQYCMLYFRGDVNFFAAGINSVGFINVTNTNTQGHFLGTRNSSTNYKGYKNGSTILSSNVATVSDNTTMYIGAAYRAPNPFLYDNRQYAFASIGDGLTDTEAANFYTVVQAFQTILGRQV